MECIGLEQAVQKTGVAASDRSGGEAIQETRSQHANAVIPVKQLKRVVGDDLFGVGPRSPAEHAADHAGEGAEVALWFKHGRLRTQRNLDGMS